MRHTSTDQDSIADQYAVGDRSRRGTPLGHLIRAMQGLLLIATLVAAVSAQGSQPSKVRDGAVPGTSRPSPSTMEADEIPSTPDLRRRWSALLERIATANKPSDERIDHLERDVAALAEDLIDSQQPLVAAALLRHWGRALHTVLFVRHRALEPYSRAASLYRSGGEPSVAAKITVARGTILWELSRYDEALAEYRRAADHFELIGDLDWIAAIAFNRGGVHHRRSHYQDALAEYQRAESHYAARKNERRLAQIALNRGHVYERLSRYEEALVQFSRAEVYFERLKDREGIARVAWGRGNLYQRQAQFKEALRAYDQASTHFQAVGDEGSLAQIEEDRGNVHVTESRYDAALSAFARAATYYERVGDLGRLAQIALNRGVLYVNLSRHREALAEFDRAATHYDRVGDEGRSALIMLNRGGVFRRLSRYEEALQAFSAAFAHFERAGDVGRIAAIEFNRGAVFAALSRFQDALDAYERSSPHFEEVGDHLRLGQIAENKGGVYAALSHHKAALEWYARAESHYEHIGSPHLMAGLAEQRGGVYASLSRFEDGLAAYARAESYYRQVGDEGALAATAQSRGIVYARLSRYESALLSLAEAAAYFERVGDEGGLAAISQNRGVIYQRLSRHDEALEALDRAASHFQRVGDRRTLATIDMSRGLVYRSLSRHDDALAAFARAERHFDQVGDEGNSALIAANRGLVYSSLNRYDDALSALARAGSHFERAGDDRRLARITEDRGIIYQILSRYEEAIQSYYRALDLIERYHGEEVSGLGGETSAEFRGKRAWLPRVVAQCVLKLREKEKVRETEEDASRVALAFRALEVICGREVAAGLTGTDRRPRANELDGSSRARLDEIASDRQHVLERREELGMRGAAEGTEGLVEKLEALQREEQLIVEAWRLTSPLAAQVAYPDVVGAAEIGALLPQDGAVIELALDPDCEMAWGFVIDGDGLSMVELGDAQAISKAIRQVKSIADARRVVPSALLRRLGRLVIDPVLEVLPKGEARPRRLFFALHGELARLPVEILLIENARGEEPRNEPHALLQEFSVSYVPSASTWFAMRRRGTRARPVKSIDLYAMGFPLDYRAEREEAGREDVSDKEVDAILRGSEREILWGTGEEVLALARLVATSVRDRESLNEAVEILDRDDLSRSPELARIAGDRFVVCLRAGANEHAYKEDEAITGARIVHLACHGEADLTSPVLSRLVLAQSPVLEEKTGEDGFVYLRELRDRELSAELLALSVCESNEGTLHPAEGLQSLAYAGLLAGARSVLSTLWRVEDEASRHFILDFYRRLLGGNNTRAEALVLSKRAAIERGVPMRTWAAFVLWDAE